MRSFAIILASCSIWAGAAYAQDLTIRSGDHPTFSRITVPLPPAQEWSARQTTLGVELSLPGFTGTFDTAEVFTRMQTDRISRIAIQDQMLVFQIICDCIASAFRSGLLLVIDVADQGTAMVGEPMQRSPEKVQVAQKTFLKLSPRPAATLPWIGGNSPFGASVSPTNGPGQTEQIKASPTEGITPLAERADLLREVQKTLAEEVANAATMGLLENSFTTSQMTDLPVDSSGDTDAVKPKQLPNFIDNPSKNVRITSSIDRPIRDSSTEAHATSSGIICPKDDFLSIETWGNDTSFSAQIGPARNALMNARDRLDIDAAKHLAKTYIYFGFGAEALNTLRMDPSLLRDFPYLSDVAQIMEYGALNRPNSLSAFTDCGSSVALWASLSFKEIPSDALLNTDAGLLALNKLPKHLRQLAAPALSTRFLKYGDAQAAAAAMRSVERLPDAPGPESLMAQAALAIDGGQSAETLLDDVIDTNTAQSPSALMKLVDGKLKRGEPLSPETATLVEAYAHELRGTELGNQLRQTQVVALSQSGRFAEAFEALETIKPSLSPQKASVLKQTVLEQLTEIADDFDFLEHVFAQDSTVISLLPPQTSLGLAARLMNLGFAAQVQNILSTVPDTPRTAERQILAARSALLLRQPFQAQAALIGIEGSEAELILAQAKEMSGAYREASEIFANNDASVQAAEAAWLSDEWRDLTPTNSPNFGAVATLAQPSQTDASIGPLGRANRALEESTAARDTLEQLLRDPIFQVTPDS